MGGFFCNKTKKLGTLFGVGDFFRKYKDAVPDLNMIQTQKEVMLVKQLLPLVSFIFSPSMKYDQFFHRKRDLTGVTFPKMRIPLKSTQ